MPLLDADPIIISRESTTTYLAGLGTAVPSQSWPQIEILPFVLNHFPIQDSTKALYRKTFSNPSIRKRHFALADLSEVLEKDHAKINKRFEQAASQLAKRSLTIALLKANLKPDDVDCLITTTCTGYLCPGLSSFIIEKTGLRKNIHTADLTGMGCGAAIPALQQAHNYVQTHPGSIAAVVCTEICSAAMFSNDAPDIVISNTLFADGSACVVLRSGGENTSAPRLVDFSSLLVPEWREDLRFVVDSGYLKNVLGKDVPKQSAEAAQKVIFDLLQKNELQHHDIHHWVLHPGGEKIINAFQKKMELSPEELTCSRTILRNFGNMSSASVLFVLENIITTKKIIPGDKAILISFGAGFSAYAALLEFPQ